MIAMQYSITLPADYDMAIIERRVRNNGHLLDDHAPLCFKAYLAARKGSLTSRSRENLYAPFYLWNSNEGMRDFLSSAGFEGLTGSFGWPRIGIWPAMLSLHRRADLSAARFASRQLRAVAPFTNLAELRQAEERRAAKAIESAGAMLAMTAFEPTTWTMVNFCLWPDAKMLPTGDDVSAYEVLHVSDPGRQPPSR